MIEQHGSGRVPSLWLEGCSRSQNELAWVGKALFFILPVYKSRCWMKGCLCWLWVSYEPKWQKYCIWLKYFCSRNCLFVIWIRPFMHAANIFFDLIHEPKHFGLNVCEMRGKCIHWAAGLPWHSLQNVHIPLAVKCSWQ